MRLARFEFSLFGINTYVVFDPVSKECAIIDPGISNEEERRAMKNFIESNGLHVKYIINTHLHIDHAIGNKWAEETYKVPVYAHPDDAMLGDRLKEQTMMFGLPLEADKAPIGEELKNGQILRIGEGELKVIHVPGHSPGSIALYDKDDGFLISGDALFNNSIGRTDLPGGSFKQLIKSIKDNLLSLPEDTIVYPGHGPETTIGREKRSNPYLIV